MDASPPPSAFWLTDALRAQLDTKTLETCLTNSESPKIPFPIQLQLIKQSNTLTH